MNLWQGFLKFLGLYQPTRPPAPPAEPRIELEQGEDMGKAVNAGDGEITHGVIKGDGSVHLKR